MPAVLPLWPSAEKILLRPGQGVGLNLLRGGDLLSRYSFKKDNQNICTSIGGPELGLRHALMTLALPTFIVRMPL
jgi:hypothetical protein